MADPEKRPSKARSMTAEAFIGEFADHTHRMPNKRFCFLLGAGASKSSGISLGDELALDWLKEMHQQESPGESFEAWATAGTLDIEGFELSKAASFYTRIFERHFDGRMDTGQFWLEEKFGRAIPFTGYYFLAQILGGSRHKVVLTTNFDNLAADAVMQLTGHLPRIISDARIARHLRPESRLPIVAKIHGDIGFATMANTRDTVGKLHDEWRGPLRGIFDLYTPIVIGWEGNDGSLMDFLTTKMVGEDSQSLLPSGLYWCYRPETSWPDRLAANPKLARLAQVHTIRFIAIEGFDDFVFRLSQSLELGNPLETLRQQQEQRLKVFGAQVREEATRIEKTESEEAAPGAPPSKAAQDLRAMVEVHEATREKDPEKRLQRLRAVAEKYPQEADAHGALAWELYERKENPDEADRHYRIATELQPKNVAHLGDYALFLQNQRKDDERAEEYYKKALAADPGDATNLGNYALFLENQRKDDERAEEYYQKALVADPNHGPSLANYAEFLIARQRSTEGGAMASRAWARRSAGSPITPAHVAFSRWLLASMSGRDGTPALGRLKSIIRGGVPAGNLNLDILMGGCLPKLDAQQAELARRLAAAILDAGQLPELEADPTWQGVPAIPLDSPWPDEPTV